MNKAIVAIETVYTNGNVILPECVNQNGHHCALKGDWGGGGATEKFLGELDKRLEKINDSVKTKYRK